MQKCFIFSLFVILLLGNFLLLQAQSESSIINQYGRVSSLNTDKQQITIVTSKGETIMATFDKPVELKQVAPGETTLRNAIDITFAQITIGDNAMVRGIPLDKNSILARQIIIITQSDIAKRQDQKREEWKQRGITGIVKKVDPTTGKISVQVRGVNSQLIDFIPGSNTIFQRYETNAKDLKDFKPSNLEAIKEGDQIRGLGNRSADGLQFTPEEVFSGSFRTIIGKILSVNSEVSEIKLTDLHSGKTLTVIVNSGSNLRRLTQDSIKSGVEKISSSDNKQNPASITKDTANSINLTNLLEKSPKITIADIKGGETVVVATSAETADDRINGITVVAGLELLNIQTGSKSSSNGNKKFNLDVF